MKIRIEEIANNSKVKFSNLNVSGIASFVPSGGNLAPNVGDIFIVETAQKSVSAFKREVPQVRNGITALATPGDYHVVAPVDTCWEDGVVAVIVGDATFMLDASDIDGPIPRKNELVSFIIHGLSLYDTGL